MNIMTYAKANRVLRRTNAESATLRGARAPLFHVVQGEAFLDGVQGSREGIGGDTRVRAGPERRSGDAAAVGCCSPEERHFLLKGIAWKDDDLSRHDRPEGTIIIQGKEVEEEESVERASPKTQPVYCMGPTPLIPKYVKS